MNRKIRKQAVLGYIIIILSLIFYFACDVDITVPIVTFLYGLLLINTKKNILL